MDGSAFDKLVQLIGGGSTRRSAMKAALAGTAASTVAALGFAKDVSETEAKKKKKKCKKCKGKGLGESCTTNKECCTNETNRLCAFSFDSPTTLVCCGGIGASCSSSDECCGDFTCEGGVCSS